MWCVNLDWILDQGEKKAIVDIIGTVGEFEYGLLDNMIILYKSSWCNNDNCGFVREYLSS